MRAISFASLILLAFLSSTSAQVPGFDPSNHPDDGKLPNGKDRSQEILKADHEKTLEDARQLVSLAESLQKNLENAGAFVMSLGDIKKTEEIERLAKRIRSRVKR